MVEAKKITIVTNLNVNNLIIKTTITRATMDNTMTHVEPLSRGKNTQFRGRSCGHPRGNYRGCGHGQSNYLGNANYQYHQYHGHDEGQQQEQYGPPCALCSV